MLEKIFRLGKETAIYGLSSIVGRFLNFLLVPFYTNLLIPSEYGVIANLYSYLAFAAIVFTYGMDAAYMRFVVMLEIGDKKQNFSTPFLSLAATSLVLSVAIHTGSQQIARWIGIQPWQHDLIRIAAWILFFDALTAIPFACLRMENKASTFAALKILNIVLTIVFNVVLLVGFRMKAEGVLLANMLASAITFGVLLRTIIPNFTRRFSRPLYRELLKFGLPYLPAGLASVAMQVIDRPILMALTNETTVGIYQANYRLGVFMMLVVGMFDYAWRPFFLKHANDQDARELFARVFTYFCVVAFGVFLVVSLFLEDLIRIKFGETYFIHPNYWGGVAIVPIVLLAYIFNGAYVNFVVGVYLEKKSKYLPYVFGMGAVVNVVANFLLIPRYGIMGAAYATLLAYAVIAIGIYLASQRYYKVTYEWQRIVTLIAATVMVFSFFGLSRFEPLSLAGIGGKIGLLVAFALLLVIGRVIEPRELEETKAALVRMFSRTGS